MENIEISVVRRATNSEWDELWENCRYATYFHSRQWAENCIVGLNKKLKKSPIIFEFTDGITALLPLCYTQKYFFSTKRYLSSPAGTYGGWISRASLSYVHDELIKNYILSNFKPIIMRVNPFKDNAEAFVCDVVDETHAINLFIGFEGIKKVWSKGHLSGARKAKREGVTVREAQSEEDWQVYFSVYQDSLRRWGDKATSKYTWKFFKGMHAQKSNYIKLWLAEFNGNIVAGALCFYSKKHVCYWHGAALEEYFKVRPVNFLISEIIEKACNDGFDWFDFNPSGGHEGVKKFKQSFGAEAKIAGLIVT